jgi:hypothetical protein
MKILFLFLILAGCSTPGVEEPYRGTGETQINVSFDGNWSVGSKTVFLGIYEFIKHCDYKFLGDIKINDEAKRSIMIPSGKKVILRTVFMYYGYQTRKERTQDFLFIPKKNQVYDVDIYERDGSLGNSVRLQAKNEKIEVDSLEEKCAHR